MRCGRLRRGEGEKHELRFERTALCMNPFLRSPSSSLPASALAPAYLVLARPLPPSHPSPLPLRSFASSSRSCAASPYPLVGPGHSDTTVGHGFCGGKTRGKRETPWAMRSLSEA